MRYVLIHGGMHGAWCWSRLIPEIEALGHAAIAIDLPGHGERYGERSTLADRCKAMVDVMQPGDVLVGHSGGGFDVTIAANAAPDLVHHVIYLAAGLPHEGKSVNHAVGGKTRVRDDGTVEVVELKDDDTGMSKILARNDKGQLYCNDFEGTRAYFYHDCDDATAKWAFAQLTPVPTEAITEAVSVPVFWTANLPRSYIECLDDRAKSHHMSELVCQRLGVTPLTIDSSHSPFLSKPAELAALLITAVHTEPHGPLHPD